MLLEDNAGCSTREETNLNLVPVVEAQCSTELVLFLAILVLAIAM